MSFPFRFQFKPVARENKALVQRWLKAPHVSKWFYGKGLENTLRYLDDFLEGVPSSYDYWLAFEKEVPFAFFMTSWVKKPEDELSHYCKLDGEAITLDFLIGDSKYLGRGLSRLLIGEFLLSQFSGISEVLMDPECSNTHAIHVYQKVGFQIVEEFIPSHSPYPHYMMRFSMKNLKIEPYYLECYNDISSEYEDMLLKGISDYAFEQKKLSAIHPFSIFIKDLHQQIVGGISGATFYGSLYIDSLWIDSKIRHQGFGTKLVLKAEELGKKREATFVTVHTMDWEGLLFYQKLEYMIEFVREGYEKDSRMFLLRKSI